MKMLLTPTRFQNVLDAAEELFGVERRALLTRRTSTAAAARLACYAAMRRACEASYPEIGALFDRDHSTIIDGVRAAEARAERDAEYEAAIDTLARCVRLSLPQRRAA